MVSAAMSLNKFSSIMSNIHFSNNNELDITHRIEGAPLKSIKVIDKQPRGSYDVALDQKVNVCLVRWDDSRVVTVASTYAGVAQVRKAKR